MVQIFLIQNPILFSKTIFFDTEAETIQKMENVLKPRSLETETSHSGHNDPLLGLKPFFCFQPCLPNVPRDLTAYSHIPIYVISFFGCVYLDTINLANIIYIYNISLSPRQTLRHRLAKFNPESLIYCDSASCKVYPRYLIRSSFHLYV